MTDTQVLLDRIAALRQQLEQVQRLANAAESRIGPRSRDATVEPASICRLEHRAAAGAQHNILLDNALRQLMPVANSGKATFPKQLTARARRILEQGRGLLDELRRLADTLDSLSLKEQRAQSQEARAEGSSSPGTDPLPTYYRETTAMADTALRLIQAFPDAPSAQLRLCDGLEVIMGIVAERVAALAAVVELRGETSTRVDTLADLLSRVHEGKPVEIGSFATLAESLLAEADQAAPLRFPPSPCSLPHERGRGLNQGETPSRFIACHSLTVAQVTARLVRNDPELREAPLQPMLAALLHDAGMMSVPAEILAQSGPLDPDQKRCVERHTLVGAEMMTRLLPGGAWLAEVAGSHHERLNGTGYPSGLQGTQIGPLTRLIAVCDVYAALCSPRPHRPALDTRTALTDTLLLAEQGTLDAQHAERLLQLSFYPVGSVVELADGAVGVVVAVHPGGRDLTTPARPVVALLTDVQRRYLPVARHLDLAQCEDRSVMRTLAADERRELLGKRYPELV
jgi:HD-GYP domain-containing protein (c-di-GMP phosphodiesterase class II)